MAKMGDWRLDKDDEIPLDGIGGVNIVVKADVHRSGEFPTPACLPAAAHHQRPASLRRRKTLLTARTGVNFPCYAFENQAETEGFAKMARRAGYGVYGLPNYVVWHIDTDEKPGNL